MRRLRPKNEALGTKTKQLIALAIGVATRCDGCIGFQTEALVTLGATRAQVGATDAIGAFEQFSDRAEVPAAQLAE